MARSHSKSISSPTFVPDAQSALAAPSGNSVPLIRSRGQPLPMDLNPAGVLPARSSSEIPLNGPPAVSSVNVSSQFTVLPLSSTATVSLVERETSSCDYDVGYGKPPRRTQFRKGQSGNPKGRSKGSKNLWTILQEEAQTVVAFSENGKPTKASKQALAIKSAMNKAVKGDLRALQIVLKLFEKYAPPSAENNSGDNGHAAAVNRQEMDREILSMLGLIDTLSPAVTAPGIDPPDGKEPQMPKASSH